MTLRTQKFLIALSDLTAQIFAYFIGVVSLAAYGGYSHFDRFLDWWQTTGEIHTLVQLIFAVLVLMRFYTKGLYTKRLPFWDELRNILMTLVYLALLNGMVVLIAKWPFSRVLWLVSWLAAMVLIPVFRAWVRTTLRRAGLWNLPTVIVGAGETAWSTFLALKSEPGVGFQVKKFISLNDEIAPALRVEKVSILSMAQDELLQAIAQDGMKFKNLQVIIALENGDQTTSANLLEHISLLRVDVMMVPPLIGLPIFGMETQHFFSHEVLLLRSKNNLGFRPQILLKRAFDLCAASFGIVLISPILLWIAVRIRQAGSDVLFYHTRIGKNGKTFRCMKFRTMVPNAEKLLKELLENDPEARREWEEKTKISNDPRITPIGHFLRRTSLDELPQLFNVIKGDMSLVGPRPIIQDEVKKFGDRFEFYKNVRPGLTGLWQVSGRSNTNFDYRVHLDTWYVKNWSLWYDIAILFKTIHVVIKRDGAI